MNWAKVALFAGGALFGSAGIEILTSKDAKEINEERAAADEAAVVADEAAEDKAAE